MTTAERPRIRLAQLGYGQWGRNVARNLNALGAVDLVCDPDPGNCELARQLVPQVRASTDPQAAFGPEIDGIVIATPAVTHYALARKGLEAGKDIYVEKPLALEYGHGHDLVQLAERNARILMVGHVLEYHPAIEKLLQLVRSGELGDLLYLYSTRVSFGIVRNLENILWSFAPHDIAVILRLMGKMPFQVTATGGSYLQPNVADVTVTSLQFDNGARAYIHVSWLHPFKEQRLVVIGSRRMASFCDISKKLIVYDQRVDVVGKGLLESVRGDGWDVPFDLDEPLRRECQAFLDSIRTRRPPLTDGRSGLRVLQVLEASQRSLVMNGQPVSLPMEGI